MQRARVRRVAVLAVLVLALLAGGAVASRPATVRVVDATISVTSTNFTVTGVSYYFAPNLIENLSIGTKYYVNFTDADASGAAHTFTILGREGIVYPSGTDITKVAYNRSYPALLNINATNSPSAVGTYPGSFTSPATAGWYEFVCTESGHFALGMYGFVSFGEALPANLSVTTPSTGPGTSVFIIVGTIVALTVIAIVLGFVIGRRHGAEQEMAPERLGYPEPLAPAEAPPLSPGVPPPKP